MYNKTHTYFKMHRDWNHDSLSWPDIEMLRDKLGDNNPMQVLQERKWFTWQDRIWIRKDCLDNNIATWFALKAHND
jgi:hypothetical protein